MARSQWDHDRRQAWPTGRWLPVVLFLTWVALTIAAPVAMWLVWFVLVPIAWCIWHFGLNKDRAPYQHGDPFFGRR